LAFIENLDGFGDSSRPICLNRYVAKMLIRSATVEDAPAISALVTASAREHIASSLFDGGLSHLLSEMTTENQVKRIRNGYQFFVALESDTLIGTAAIRLPAHLYYLFVDTQPQRRGIGRQLWNHARDWIASSTNHGSITVNSSLNAIKAYERLGFAIAGPPEENHGIRYQPMRWANADL
jgi:GNAT superfamily N-acetyltransferase